MKYYQELSDHSRIIQDAFVKFKKQIRSFHNDTSIYQNKNSVSTDIAKIVEMIADRESFLRYSQNIHLLLPVAEIFKNIVILLDYSANKDIIQSIIFDLQILRVELNSNNNISED